MLQLLDQVRIILINTTHPGNIGGAARAMKNMGLSELVLVEPRCFPSEEADRRAVSAKDILDKAVVVDTVEEALEGCGLVLGTSARERRIPWPLFDPRDSAEQAKQSLQKGNKVAIMFGREDRGLTNEELQKCHFHVHIPTNEDYSSLNLAAAVQVLSYELRMSLLGEHPLEQKNAEDWDYELADAGEVEKMMVHLEQVLTEIEFLDPENPRQVMARLRRLYNRQRLDTMEVNILRGILASTQKTIAKSQK
ncbi:tRNA (cytidine/uridine/adenosine-2'-O-)-methyltransferase TrmJ [Sinobacterium norvegicum]|uniref:tRNA (cytidine/uridine-2'-O-)-methyltransferase TrmJ n=1 Tax=Sinobacterium norvegicum TaxID=1641715 RepID=A0ABM9AIP4_9GAMM|nr:RNA methyltransferase [Sinobacterium norvegicum]CAH0992642.1 tRNA (cytidine/uridine/adenosine-2'-O-)-methyltransferase TrmJ [Sinobacterium norvegicum]